MDRGARWSALLDLLAQHGRLSVAQVVESLGVSEATVRRDFGDLAAQQLVTRTHGGVVASAVAYDLPARYKQAGSDTAKERIASFAADLVAEGSVVGFNGGTTTSATARRLAARSDLAISLEAAVDHGRDQRPQHRHRDGAAAVHPVRLARRGGAAGVLRALRAAGLDGAGRAVARHRGARGRRRLGGRRRDLPARGRGGHQLAHGRSAPTASSWWPPATRWGARAFARICPSDRIKVLVTDATAPADAVEELRAAGVTVEVV